jgi:hypothetical protein
MVWVKPNGEYWQICQNVDAAGVADGLGYWKNYAGFQVTPTIGNSTRNEVAGVYHLAVTQDYFCCMHQGGDHNVLSVDMTYADGQDVCAAPGSNQLTRNDGVITGALAAVDSAGGVMSVVNPFGEDVYIDLLVPNRTTATSGACTIDYGVTPTNGTTLSDNLIDGQNANAAAAAENNLTNPGTNGKARQLWKSGIWVTGSVASGASAGLVGTYSIYFAHTARRKTIGVATGVRASNRTPTRLKIIPA